ncbi:type IV toxin-antitoxin system AbiEi family antitoxin [uncultured Bacteroides sp.]|uniref:type IV toxin-antitoxin system AbiEi family antitoxin domain-containing protein n=1 Tax=uncultured Bacteroides sp. TaxID=162156 RepID=UPI002AA65A43|nr:type IV toxin-antitoxin system AbiEi family antitoxin [uncultured Bacteroides sp.]
MQQYIEQLHSLKLFELKDIINLTGKKRSAQELLRNYAKRNLVVQIRRNLYSVTDLASKATIANKYEIGSHISQSSYISYHSALEYHGLAHQLFYNLSISSDSRFNDFDFEDIHYSYCKSNSSEGVEVPPMDSLVRVTSLERTIVDCLDRIDRSGGLEELVHSLAMIPYLNENKLQHYLAIYDKAFLYKKVGFILQLFQENLKLSADFISFCHQKGALHVKHLTDPSESGTFYRKWNIYAPENILSYLEQGNNELV